MVNPIAVGLIVYGLAEAYSRNVSPESKRRFENWIKSHHGEWGVLGIIAGAATESPNLFASGLALAYHDRRDADKWFKGNNQLS